MDIEASAPRSPRAAFTIVADAGGMIPSSRAERNRHTPHYASSPQRNVYTGVPPQHQPASLLHFLEPDGAKMRGGSVDTERRILGYMLAQKWLIEITQEWGRHEDIIGLVKTEECL